MSEKTLVARGVFLGVVEGRPVTGVLVGSGTDAHLEDFGLGVVLPASPEGRDVEGIGLHKDDSGDLARMPALHELGEAISEIGPRVLIASPGADLYIGFHLDGIGCW